MIMPFGKFRGWGLEDLPRDYLLWLKSRPNLREPLRGCVTFEWARGLAELREPDWRDADALHIEPSERELFRQVVDAGYRQLALRFHPDVGGRAADMRRLNALVEGLREQLGRI